METEPDLVDSIDKEPAGDPDVKNDPVTLDPVPETEPDAEAPSGVQP